MTSIDPSASPFAAGVAPVKSKPAAEGWWWTTVEGALDRASERLNPILVKEARQALKSKQFVITFTLLLLAGWVWSLLGVALLSPGVYYAPGGRFMLTGYFIVLAIPLLVIVPFSAFRSLAAEREDGTFELLSITTLSSRQIVTGKLGSAVLQMLVYYSALAPCVAFTYLLRGIDIVTILFLLFYTFVASLLLSAFGLMVATATRSRHWQVLLSVLLLIGLLLATYAWTVTFSLLIHNGQPAFDDPNFWLAQAAIITMALSFVALFILAASSQISFASDNRSTRLRVMMLIQQMLWVGWMMFFWIRLEEEAFLYLLISMAGLYWFAAGAGLMGEMSKISPRVRRSLPQSFLGRMSLTWFNPGPGTGYVFAALNMIAVSLLVIMAGLVAEIEGFRGIRAGAGWLPFCSLAAAYVVAYLGAARLLVLALGQVGHVSMLLTVLVNLLLAILGVAMPVFLEAWRQGYSRMSYSLLQVPNWIWTLDEAGDGSLGAADFVPLSLYAAAAVLFLLNLMFAAVEIEQVRQAVPDRILEDERELHPERLQPTPPRRNPWD